MPFLLMTSLLPMTKKKSRIRSAADNVKGRITVEYAYVLPRGVKKDGRPGQLALSTPTTQMIGTMLYKV